MSLSPTQGNQGTEAAGGMGGGGAGMISGIQEAGGMDQMLGQANETTNAQSQATNDANAAGQDMSQQVSGANRDGGKDSSQEARSASVDAAADAANQGL